ncbi:baseplate assembly protein [Betaproteobacteria bacterium]|nr:baseplate assembly protein [Betaproteobacteria bacterium]
MDMTSGVPLDLIDHIRQSVWKAVTTPIGSRVMRRDYGSLIPELIDAPINDRVRLLIMAATCTAVIKWESRIRPARVWLAVSGEAALTVEITAALKEGPSAGKTVLLLIPLK